jgi:dTDP-4-dehydrorhamnose reductase
VRAEGVEGIGPILAATWERYRRPIAVTEAFLGAPGHDQVRWVQTIWNAARAARARGIPVRSVTSWSLLGSYEWTSLVTRRSGAYEPGAFDLSTPGHPETEIAAWIRTTAAGLTAATRPSGWWETSARLLFPPVVTSDPLDSRAQLERPVFG